MLDLVDETVNSPPAEAVESAAEAAAVAAAADEAAAAAEAAAELQRRRRCKSLRVKRRLKLQNQGIYALDDTFCY